MSSFASSASSLRPLRPEVCLQEMTKQLRRILSLDDFEEAARKHLPRPVFGYVSGGCETDASLRGNRNAFADYGFVPRVLQGVAQRSQSAQLFGHTWSAP